MASFESGTIKNNKQSPRNSESGLETIAGKTGETTKQLNIITASGSNFTSALKSGVLKKKN